MLVQHGPSFGEDIFKHPELWIAENSAVRVVVYWKNGRALERDELPPKAAGATRVVCISDTHTKTAQFATEKHLQLPSRDEYDVLVHGGDFTSTGTHAQTKDFAQFLDRAAKRSVIIAGNHDTTFHAEYYAKTGAKRFHGAQPQTGNPREFLPKSCTYLEDSATAIGRALVWGSPWQPEFCDWAFNLGRKSKEIEAKWKLIPKSTSILITHGPPHGRLGGICRDGFDAGCEVLRERVKKIEPLIHVCGHIHEAYGCYVLGKTLVINASSVNLSYRPVNPPIVFDVFDKA